MTHRRPDAERPDLARRGKPQQPVVVNVHLKPDPAVSLSLTDIARLLVTLQQQIDKQGVDIMAVKEQVASIKALVTTIREGTDALAVQSNRIGAGVDALQKQVADLKLARQDDPELTAALTDIEDGLKTTKAQQDTLGSNLENIGTDAETPVPDPTPLPEEPPVDPVPDI